MVEDLTLIKKLDIDDFGDIYLSSKKGDNSYYATHICKKKYSLSEFGPLFCLKNYISICLDTNHPNIIKLFEIKETANSPLGDCFQISSTFLGTFIGLYNPYRINSPTISVANSSVNNFPSNFFNTKRLYFILSGFLTVVVYNKGLYSASRSLVCFIISN